MEVQLLTPTKSIFSGNAKHVNVPGIYGYLGILPKHAGMVSELAKGLLKIEAEGSDPAKTWEITGGFVEVTTNKVVLMVESATPITVQ